MDRFEKTKLLGSDFDDTITSNSMEVYVEELYLPVLRNIGIILGAEEFKKIVEPVWGQSALEVIQYVVARVSTREGTQLNSESILSAVGEYEERLRSGVFVNKVELVPGAIDTLEAVRSRGVQIGLATGLAPELLKQILDNNGVPRDFFIEKISSYDIVAQKPDPYSLRVLRRMAEIIRASHIINRAIVYVGDSANDVRMARALPQVEPVVVLTGNLTEARAREELDIPSTNILANVCYIEEVLERRETEANL